MLSQTPEQPLNLGKTTTVTVPTLKGPAVTTTATAESAQLVSLTQANNALKSKNAQNVKVTNTILSRAEELSIPEKITLVYILRNWRKIGEFVEQIIHMLKALRNNA